MLEIEVLLTERQLAEEFLAALERRYLAEKFFYWLPLSVKAWLDLCRGDAPYKNFARSYNLLAKHAVDIACQCPGEKMEVVSLGAGQGDKDLLVLEAVRAKGSGVRYGPVDSSQALLELAVMRGNEAAFATRGLKADLINPQTVQRLATSALEPRLYLLLGNTLSVTDPMQFLALLRTLLRPEDRLLLDGEVFDSQETMRGYDNPVNRRFAFAPLASLGLEEDRDGVLVFESETDGRREGLHTVSKHFRAARRLKIPVAGQWVEVGSGEKIDMNSSWKYSRATFLSLLQEIGGLEILKDYSSDDEHFLMILARRRSEP